MALPYDYSKLSKYYEVLEPDLTQDVMPFLNKTLRKHGAKSVIDLTCGTGRQLFWLAKHGYKIVGSDISPGMLKIAEESVKKRKLKIRLQIGDMRNIRLGTFDAAITIFNAIGHLTKPDFEHAIRNISRNLKRDGLYIFDIFNLEYMKKNFRTYRYVDTATEVNGITFVRFNHNTFDKRNGIMYINQETLIQTGHQKPQTFKESWTMQIYSAEELQKMLKRNGFEVLGQYSIDGSKFSKTKSTLILTVARKQK